MACSRETQEKGPRTTKNVQIAAKPQS